MRVYETEVQKLLERSEESREQAVTSIRCERSCSSLRPGSARAGQMLTDSAGLIAFLEGIQTVVFTGSGSSEYAGECVRLVLQNELVVAAQTIGGGVFADRRRARDCSEAALPDDLAGALRR